MPSNGSYYSEMLAEQHSLARDALYKGNKNRFRHLLELSPQIVNLNDNYEALILELAYLEIEDFAFFLNVLVAAKADLDCLDREKKTALMRVAENGNAIGVKELIAAKAELNLQDKVGNTALMLVIKKYKELGSYGPDDERTSLKVAKYLGIIKELVFAKSNLNLQGEKGNTALMVAIEEYKKYGSKQYKGNQNYLEIVRELVSLKPDLSIKNEDGNTVLMLSVGGESKTIDFVQELIKAGVVLDERRDKDQNTALMVAVEECDVAAVRALIAAEAGIDLQNKDGDTALILAMKKENMDIAKKLIKAGASPDPRLCNNSSQNAKMLLTSLIEDERNPKRPIFKETLQLLEQSEREWREKIGNRPIPATSEAWRDDLPLAASPPQQTGKDLPLTASAPKGEQNPGIIQRRWFGLERIFSGLTRKEPVQTRQPGSQGDPSGPDFSG